MFSEPKPIISVEAVSQALNTLIYVSTVPKLSELYQLRIVEAFMNNPNFPQVSYSHQFALEKVLTDLILQHFYSLSEMFHIPLPLLNQSYTQTLTAMQFYARTTSPEMIGYGWLYCHFIRSELAISPQTFCSLFHISDRTLRRYHQYAIKKLTDLLIEQEWRILEQDV